MGIENVCEKTSCYEINRSRTWGLFANHKKENELTEHLFFPFIGIAYNSALLARLFAAGMLKSEVVHAQL